MGLSFRRMFAFVADCLILAPFLSAVYVVVLLEDMEWTTGLDLISLAIVLGYFGIWDGIRGQTPGKMLLSIRVRKSGGENVDLYAAFLRIALIVFTPAVLKLISDPAWQLFGLSDKTWWGWILSLGEDVLCVSIWSISILLGKGRVGLHDMIADTEVIARQSGGEEQAPEKFRYIMTTLVTTVTFSLVVVSPTAPFHKALSSPDYADYWRVIGELTVDTNVLSQQIPDGSRYFNRNLSVFPGALGLDFNDSSLKLPEVLRGRILKRAVSYEIGTTRAGYYSREFQQAIANQLAIHVQKTLDNVEDLAMIFAFSYAKRLGTVHITLRRFRIGMWTVSREKEALFVLLDGDHSTWVAFHISSPGRYFDQISPAGITSITFGMRTN